MCKTKCGQTAHLATPFMFIMMKQVLQQTTTDDLSGTKKNKHLEGTYVLHLHTTNLQQ